MLLERLSTVRHRSIEVGNVERMATDSEALALAAQHRQFGRFDLAERVYEQILTASPRHPVATHYAGLVAFELGREQSAIELLERSIALNPLEPIFHGNLGVILYRQGKPDAAIASYQRALQIQPDFADAHNNLGNALRSQGRLSEAAASYRRALRINPNNPAAHNNLGVVLFEENQPEEAVACYRSALQINPNYADAHNNLGNVSRSQGRLEESEAIYRRALRFNPGYAEAHNNLGNALRLQGKLEEARRCCERALELNPDYVAAHFNLGNVFKSQGKLSEAVACYRRTLEFDPDYAAAHSNLGNALWSQGKLEEAVVCCRRALELNPDESGAHLNLGNALKHQGKLSEAVASYERALELNPEFFDAHSSLLMTRQNVAGVSLEELFEAHSDFERRYAAPLRADWKPHDIVRDPDRPLRLGFLSPDFGRHPVGYFLIRVLENLERREAQTNCYSDGTNRDELTARFQTAAANWQETVGWSDERLAQQIRDDKIDILFDMAGHTARNRLLVFARKPAPIQITWLGYEGTTGLTAMDYILADHHEIPAQSEKFYCEKVLRMRDGYVCYDPPAYAPPVSGLPAEEDRLVTFGSFNNPAKITDQVIEVWGKILARAPLSRLVLKYKGMSDSSIAGRFAEMLSGHGVDSRRVEFHERSPHAEALKEYHLIDLALDPFPFSGGATTCEALWMGVPVITCPGETFASRHSLSYLSNVGLTETVARDLSDYVELAVGLANDLPRLAKWRAELRERMARSPLCDGARFADNLLKILRNVWQEWCNSPHPGSPTPSDSNSRSR